MEKRKERRGGRRDCEGEPSEPDGSQREGLPFVQHMLSASHRTVGFFFFLATPWHMEFQGQGSDLSHSVTSAIAVLRLCP